MRRLLLADGRGPADGVADIERLPLFPKQRAQPLKERLRYRGLRHHQRGTIQLKSLNVLLAADCAAAPPRPAEYALHLGMSAVADHQHVLSGRRRLIGQLVNPLDERTGRVHNVNSPPV